ncbi:putative RNA-binding protein 19 [Binucleata daphniae]
MRIIVKNLPINVTEDYLKNEFSKISVLTDLSFPKNNKRNFCFVGYKTKEDAEKAVKYFNKSYIKNCKLVVELVNDDYIEKRRKLNEMIGKSECNEKEKYVESVSLQIFGLPRYDTCSTKAKKDLKGEKINDTDINQENTKKSLNSVITKKDIKNEFENVKNVT